MGKQARNNRRLEEMAAQAQDLNALATRRFIVVGIGAQFVPLQTNVGPQPGVALTLKTADDQEHGPFVMDIISGINAISAISTILGGKGVPPPQPPAVPDDPTAEVEEGTTEAPVSTTQAKATGMGLILP